jgi:excinuclease ABC subunit A
LCAIGFPIVDCQSTRLNEAARHVFIENNNLAQLTALPIGNAKTFFEKLDLPGKRVEFAAKILKEVVERLPFLVNVGLD